MSFVLVSPSQLMAAAADVAGIGSAISAANAAALAPTSVLAAAGADEVSAAVAALFSAPPASINSWARVQRCFTSSSCRH
ncbi:PE-PGRS family protein [Mycobacterium tuberculosis]|nr:PE-PGRS family protein [Mycobacterium tuberculosis]